MSGRGRGRGRRSVGERRYEFSEYISETNYGGQPVENFEDMGIPKEIINGIHDYGFKLPSEPQQLSIPAMIGSEYNNRSLVLTSQSGTGKTGCFVISSLSLVDIDIPEPQVLVVSPTRELSKQTYAVYAEIAEKTKISIGSFVGQENIEDQIALLEKGCQVCCGTCGRIEDLLKNKHLKTDKLKLFIIDEADRFTSGNGEDGSPLQGVVALMSSNVRTFLITATMDTRSNELYKGLLGKDPVYILIKQKEIVISNIKRYYRMTKNFDQKLYFLRDEIFRQGIPLQKTILFVNSKRSIEGLKRFFHDECKKETTELHADLSQRERNSNLDKFKSKSCNILIASDLIARGIDVKNVTLVINFDIPDSTSTFIHRIGRTGRFGKSGIAISLAENEEQKRFLQRIEEDYGDGQLNELPNEKDLPSVFGVVQEEKD